MTLEDFIDVYKNKSPAEKLDLLTEQYYFLRQDEIEKTNASWRGSDDDVNYLRGECMAMAERIKWLMSEIRAALAAQEPRVMTLEEVEALCMTDKIALSEEEWSELEKRPPVYVEFREEYFSCVHWRDNPSLRDWIVRGSFRREYGKRRRCWTARPTDAQREAAKWD